MWLPHGLLRTFDNSWLLSCRAWLEIWSPFQPDMGDIQWTRGHKRSPRVQPFSQTSLWVRSPPNHLNQKIRMSNPQPQHVLLWLPMNNTTLVMEVFSSAPQPTSPPPRYDNALPRRTRHHVPVRRFCSESRRNLCRWPPPFHDATTFFLFIVFNLTSWNECQKTSTGTRRYFWPPQLSKTVSWTNGAPYNHVQTTE